MIGLAFGVCEFLILRKFVRSVTVPHVTEENDANEKNFSAGKNVVLILLFVFLPLVLLVPVAVFLKGQIVFAGTGMAAALILGAVINFIREQSVFSAKNQGKESERK